MCAYLRIHIVMGQRQLTLCLSFFSGGQVAKLYRDSSLGNVVNIIVTRLIVLTEDQVSQSLLSVFVIYTMILV